MMNEALRHEPGEQTLNYTLFKMHLHYFFGNDTRVLENDWTNRRSISPVPELLITRTRSAKAVHRLSPGGICTRTLIKGRDNIAILFCAVRCMLKRFGSHYL